jgi:hypothetical protein
MTPNQMFAAARAGMLPEWGIDPLPEAIAFIERPWRNSYALAQDAQPVLQTAPNAGIPAWLTAFMAPEVVHVLQTPNVAATIYDEELMGNWIMRTAWFQVVENTGEVSSYGDFNRNGRSDINDGFVERQSYGFQTHIEYGDQQVERAGLKRLNWLAELQVSAAKTLDKFMDYTWHFGVAGLRCYGLLNDPGLYPAVTPTTKAAAGAGSHWVLNEQVVADALEVYRDFQLLFGLLASQGPGQIDENTKFKLTMSNKVIAGLGATNQYGKTAREVILQSYPKVQFVTDPRNSTAAGELIQLIAVEVDGHKTGKCAYNSKLKDHRLIPDTSSYYQKKSAGTWGAILPYPWAIASLLGV